MQHFCLFVKIDFDGLGLVSVLVSSSPWQISVHDRVVLSTTLIIQYCIDKLWLVQSRNILI